MIPVDQRIALHGATRRFGGFTALAPLELTVARGELLALLGPAGSGKTTVLRLLAGLERPTSGSIDIDGLDVTPLPPQRRDLAFAFQSPALYPHLSVERNLAFPMRARRIAPNAVERRVGEVIERLGLGDVRRRKPRHLSAEQCQLVSLGRAMVRDAKALLFDEPLAPFAGEQRDYLRRELRAIHAELRATTVLATRDPRDAITTADRICVINEGRLLQCDAPQAVYDRPADLFVARYLGADAMNFLDARRSDGAAHLACCDLAITVDDAGAQPVDPGRLTLGIRPEHVQIDPRSGAGSGVVAVASATEPRGEDQLVVLRLGDAVIRTFAPPGVRIAEGERVPIRFDPAGCRWFDATSGKALPWRTS